ncbi:adenosylcobinamide-GDP ribazoletransferase [Paenibacillus sp. WQ 127069]|uniref:Adenosylcobinamide-GDP ribazoletransferase n=1 Tax=Paenibacillus baimaensis TaxID=2982185 RepID=A0ABT2UQL4_9BACL|nr:adenosylcobinamide-GDP ribazoletransferase [Paenibacillus sp. WQ 127069]MCU6796316.1 adenosylcobinamide-GDP ribazoletransferase [Paenibacillus sp. WQ 127069]
MRTMLGLVVKVLAACAAAFQFLTRLPVPIQLQYDNALFRRSVIFYPLVGAVLGLLLSLAGLLLQGYGLPDGWLSGGIGSSGVVAALLLVLWVAMTGALHLDGLMDTADGIFSHRSREQMLEIMKDSRVGAMGVVGCMLLLLCKWTLLQQWLTLPVGTFAYLLPLSALWSRWYMVVAIACWPYARNEETKQGLGSFFRGIGWKHLSIHTALAIALSLLLAGWHEGEWISSQALMATGVALLSTLLIGVGTSMYLNRKLGGLTGDTYGAMNEIVETALLLIIYLVVR